MSFAIQYSRVLKLQILLANAKDEAANAVAMKSSEAYLVKEELRSIRDQVNRLLDSLDTRGTEVTSSTEECEYNNE